VGNLNAEINQKTLENTFSIYGDIESVDYFLKNPPFAFIKFKRCEFAQKAIES
jgi:RNA recognition motif-containing protein